MNITAMHCFQFTQKSTEMRKIIAISLFIGCGFGSRVVLAHHSFAAQFDINKPVTLTGTVTELKWSNPHGWIYIDVTDENGNVMSWALETTGVNNLVRRGWRQEDLSIGTLITIGGFQARNNTPTAAARSVTLSDGTKLFTGPRDRNEDAR
jgi:hypothetical protein